MRVVEYLHETVKNYRYDEDVSGRTPPPGRALHPCGRLEAPLSCAPSLLGVLWSKKNHGKSFIPFGIPFLRNSNTGKKTETVTGL